VKNIVCKNDSQKYTIYAQCWSMHNVDVPFETMSDVEVDKGLIMRR
jgi:hypothetical protein